MLNSIKKNENLKKVIADIGGTNARFAILNSDGSIQDIVVLKGADYPNFVSAFNAYLQLLKTPNISHAAVAIANPIEGDAIKMTNHNWSFSIEEARRSLGLDSLIFKNDFEALAMSIPHLADEDLYQVGGGKVKKKRTIGVIGAGTGLGVSGLVYTCDKWIPLSSEGGHVSLSPINKRQLEILDVCWEKHEHISAERLVSGSGLKTLYEAICQLDNVSPDENATPQIISKRALSKSNQQCIETLDVFSSLLGVIASNLALTLGAKGGIYIGGGVVPKLGAYFESSPFRESFETKGRFKNYLKEIPVFVIKSEYTALIGIKQVFDC